MCGQRDLEKMHQTLEQLQLANNKNSNRIDKLEDAHNKNKKIIRTLLAHIRLVFVKGKQVYEKLKKGGNI